MKYLNKKNKNKVAVVIFLAVALLLTLNQLNFLTFIGLSSAGQGLPQVIEIKYWESIKGDIKFTAPVFGSVTSGSSETTYSPYGKMTICGNSNGDLFLSDTYSSDTQLMMNSDFKNLAPQSCDAENYIISEFTVPKGVMIGTFYGSAKESNDGDSGGNIRISSGFNTLYSSYSNWNYQCSWANRNPTFLANSCRSPVNNNFRIVFNETTSVKIELNTYQGYTGQGTSSIILSFEESIEPTLTFYRFENNKCSIINIQENQKTNNDYLLMSDCEKNIPLNKVYYNLINNECISIQKLENQKTNNDLSLDECKVLIKNPEIQNTGIKNEQNIFFIIVIITSLVIIIFGSIVWLKRK
ncbi:MAG TPA: hypothetical protein VGB37_14540 [Candidatus Lokiarchaeia archaeon]